MLRLGSLLSSIMRRFVFPLLIGGGEGLTAGGVAQKKGPDGGRTTGGGGSGGTGRGGRGSGGRGEGGGEGKGDLREPGLMESCSSLPFVIEIISTAIKRC